MNDCYSIGYDSISLFQLQGYDSHGYDPISHDSHTKRLHPIEVSSDIEASDMFQSITI